MKLVAGGCYWARVRVVDNTGTEGQWSEVVAFRVRSGASGPDGETLAPDGGSGVPDDGGSGGPDDGGSGVPDGGGGAPDSGGGVPDGGGGAQDRGDDPGGGCDRRMEGAGGRGTGLALLLVVLGLGRLRRPGGSAPATGAAP